MCYRIDALTVCVEYDDFLALTLPRNRKHFDRVLVVTSPADRLTQKVVEDYGCEWYSTDAFYRNGAKFNKGLAIEEGLNFLGSTDWICTWDADIVIPDSIDFPDKEKDCLYAPIRLILDDPATYTDNLDWNSLTSPTMDYEFNGYFQMFHSSVPIPKPWYGTNWTHAAGCDSDFEAKFPTEKRKRPPFRVLHLGSEGDNEERIGANWMGRSTPRIDTGSTPEKAALRNSWIMNMIKDRKNYGTEKEKL